MEQCVLYDDFEWDPAKAAENVRKHGVTFDEASAVFRDPFLLDSADERFAYGEQRRTAIGFVQDTMLVVGYAERGDACRIISARAATARERRLYGNSQV